MMDIILAVFAYLILFIAGIGVFIPVIPGPIFAILGPISIYFFAEQAFPYINKYSLIIFSILVLISFVFDYLSGWWGAKKMGATWRGGVGAIIGALLFPILLAPFGFGAFGALVGFFVGPMIGAILGECFSRKTRKEIMQAGFGTFLGGIAATLLKLFVCVLIFIWLLVATWARFYP